MTYQFKIQLKGISKPTVWRRILIADNYSFYDFHLAIQIAFGWENYHMFQFSPKGYGSLPVIKDLDEDDFENSFMELSEDESFDAESTDLSEIFHSENQKYTYIYDFGDDWIHQITLEKIRDEIHLFPEIITGKGQCPPEDCGGPWGYENLLEILSAPKHPEYQHMAEWVGLENGEIWDAKNFDLKEHQEIMREVFSKRN